MGLPADPQQHVSRRGTRPRPCGYQARVRLLLQLLCAAPAALCSWGGDLAVCPGGFLAGPQAAWRCMGSPPAGGAVSIPNSALLLAGVVALQTERAAPGSSAAAGQAELC